MTKTDLKLDWCSRAAATAACRRWHYSRCMPAGKANTVGVWESGVFVGVVVFSGGAGESCNGARYGLARHFQVAELVRVALGAHATPTSRILAIATRMVTRHNPGLRMLVSFADTAQGHHGGIYQAAGWTYTGTYDSVGALIVLHGEPIHPRTLYSRYGRGGQSIPWLRKNVDPDARRVNAPPKHRYLMPLDDEMRERIAPLARPYPKRPKHSSDAPANQAGEDGVEPIRALQTSTTPDDCAT